MGVEDGVEGLADGVTVDLDLALAAGDAAQLRRDLDRDRHRPGIYRAAPAGAAAATPASNDSSDGSISLIE